MDEMANEFSGMSPSAPNVSNNQKTSVEQFLDENNPMRPQEFP